MPRVRSQPTAGFMPDDAAIDLMLLAKNAMESGNCLNFTLDGKPRIVEVHAVGVSTKDGGIVMRAFQVAGGASRPLPAWSLFRLDRMSDVKVTPRVSDAPRDGYRMGDAQMAPVLCELEL